MSGGTESEAAGLTAAQQRRLQAAIAYAAEVTRTHATRMAVVDKRPTPLITPVVNRAINRAYVGGIGYSVADKTVRLLFSRFGYVKDVSMVMEADRVAHRGYCFLEYDAPEAVELAMTYMNGVEFAGKILKVNRTNAYNPEVLRHFPPRVESRIYFANIHEHITEESLRAVFEPFGELLYFALCPDMLTHRHKTFGYAEYSTVESAAAAIKVLHNFNLAGENIMVSSTTVGGPFPDGMAALARFPTIHTNTNHHHHNINSNTNNVSTFQPLASTSTSTPAISTMELDNGIHNRTTVPAVPPARSPAPVVIEPTVMSNILILKNMAGPDEVDDDLREDVAEECGKFGAIEQLVVHISPVIPPNETGVRIFVRFATMEERDRAKNALQGRFFGGRQIGAVSYAEDDFAQQNYDE